MTHLTKLRTLFSDITLATLITQAAACTEAPRDGIDRGGFDLTVSCRLEDWPAAVHPSPPVDYVALRSVTMATRLDGGAFDLEWHVLGESGSACGGAVDPAPCTEALTAIDGPYFSHPAFPEPFTYQLVYTRGADVGTVPSYVGPDLATFVGEIDSPEEAALVVFADRGLDWRPTCTGPNARARGDGFELIYGGCTFEQLVHVHASGEIVDGARAPLEADAVCLVPGRLTEHGPRVTRARHADVGAFLAQMATHEAASVPAFTRLARELDALGAPSALVARAGAAAEDEVRHAQLVRGLARAYGVDARFSETSMPLPLRTATEVAIENVVEGCVRETFAALVAVHQATAARDVRVRTVMAAIAEDELRHAALSYDVQDWLGTILSGGAHARVEDARRAAIDALIDGDHHYDASLRFALGLPDAATHARYAMALRDRLWGAATAA